MKMADEDNFRKAYNVRRCEKCCGNCKHFERDWDFAGCSHPKQAEFDTLHTPEEINSSTYGAYGGTEVDEGNVCDLWELKTGETK